MDVELTLAMAYLTEHSQVVFSPGVNIPSTSDERCVVTVLLRGFFATRFDALYRTG